MPLFRPSILAIATIPASGLLLATYLYHRPLPLHSSRKISTSSELSQSFKPGASSKSLRLVNPRNHVLLSDSRSITFSESDLYSKHRVEVGHEEILARFVKGFFGGWSFVPERMLLGGLRRLGRKFIEVGFCGLEQKGEPINSLDGLSKTKLPPIGTVLFGGNFLVLDVCVASPTKAPEDEETSYIDIGFDDPVISYVDVAFGCDEKNFSGLHRFEVQRHHKQGELTIWYSCLSCNPSIDRPPFPGFVAAFHRWYAMCLFKDGIEGVIRG